MAKNRRLANLTPQNIDSRHIKCKIFMKKDLPVIDARNRYAQSALAKKRNFKDRFGAPLPGRRTLVQGLCC
jgi:hypothetical protein